MQLQKQKKKKNGAVKITKILQHSNRQKNPGRFMLKLASVFFLYLFLFFLIFSFKKKTKNLENQTKRSMFIC